jgi:hypothetical protein
VWFFIDKEISMARRHTKTMTTRIFENILFLEEVFGDKDAAEIPDVPILELAKSFELSQPRTLRAARGRQKAWPLWNDNN